MTKKITMFLAILITGSIALIALSGCGALMKAVNGMADRGVERTGIEFRNYGQVTGGETVTTNGTTHTAFAMQLNPDNNAREQLERVLNAKYKEIAPNAEAVPERKDSDTYGSFKLAKIDKLYVDESQMIYMALTQNDGNDYFYYFD